ncbi:UNKNOWN [Stylonychia lemnae]|uniref:Uncharacterized protein n=1 Tax=Stylonychia lemnae TaxID=5949 RepID=A0A077ZWB3_STYLE|nr:UNKNOWN [Stylonychia lemnae]|eukprot:CDW73876.1 UNKNOWN [Stylonychia lemnae]
MSISEEIANKYNILKQTTFAELNSLLQPHFKPILYELVTMSKYPNIRRAGEQPPKQVQYEIFSAMMRLSVELLHYQDYQVYERELEVGDLMRMADNVEKLFEYLPVEEIDTLKLAQNYMAEYRLFIRDKDDNKERIHLNYLKRQIKDLNERVFHLGTEKQQLEHQMQDTQKLFENQMSIFRTQHIEEVESMKKMYLKQIDELREQGLGRIIKDQDKIRALGDSIIEEMNNRSDDEEKSLILEELRIKLKQIFIDHLDSHKTFKAKEQKFEEIKYMEFVTYLLNKYKSDNGWLVERLADLNRDYQDLQIKFEALSKSIIRQTGKKQVQISLDSIKGKNQQNL